MSEKQKKCKPVVRWGIVWPNGNLHTETFWMRLGAYRVADQYSQTRAFRKQCQIVRVKLIPLPRNPRPRKRRKA